MSPDVADLISADLVGVGKTIPNWTPPAANTAEAEAQYAPLLVGQLKAIAAPFYTRLNAAAPTWLAAQRQANGTQDAAAFGFIYPWTSSSSDDSNKAIASVGQLKAVFALRFEKDADNNNLADLWEIRYFGTTGISSSADADGDGFTNVQEYAAGSDPQNASSCPRSGAALAGGDEYSLALASDGHVWAWGKNDTGQLGNGTLVNSNVPVPLKIVSGMARITRISAGLSFSGAVDENGAVWMWGSNFYGQLGNGNSDNQALPTKVALPPVSLLACGFYHTLAVDLSGNLWAWGHNYNGTYGNGTTTTDYPNPNLYPVPITRPTGMAPIIQIAAGWEESYILDANGNVWAWGHNGGSSGDGQPNASSIPVQIKWSNTMAQLPAMSEIAVTYRHVIAKAVNGSLWGWGDNSYGQLGTGNTNTLTRPQPIFWGTYPPTSIAAGWRHSLVTTSDSGLWSAGDNGYGELGFNTTNNASVYVPTPVATGFVKVAAGSYHSLAAKADGSVFSCGDNSSGQLGDGTIVEKHVLVNVHNLNLGKDDSDGDGLPDSWEYFYFGNFSKGGADEYMNAGVNNWTKQRLGLNPLSIDTDGDGMTDAWELAHGLDPLDPSDAANDPDNDGLTNLQEMTKGTDPRSPYSLYPDVLDSIAVQPGFNYSTLDYDGDGLTNVQEALLGTNPFVADTDGDGVPDNLDAFPLDPTRSSAPSGTTGDVTPPQIVLTAPEGAVPL